MKASDRQLWIAPSGSINMGSANRTCLRLTYSRPPVRTITGANGIYQHAGLLALRESTRATMCITVYPERVITTDGSRTLYLR